MLLPLGLRQEPPGSGLTLTLAEKEADVNPETNPEESNVFLQRNPFGEGIRTQKFGV